MVLEQLVTQKQKRELQSIPCMVPKYQLEMDQSHFISIQPNTTNSEERT